MVLRCGCNLILNCFKYKRRINEGKTKTVVRWNSTGLRILFFGTDTFSVPSLQKLNEERQKSEIIQSLDVITSFKKPKNPVLKFAETQNLPLHKWPLKDLANYENQFNLGVVVSFGHLIPQNVISLCSLGIINVHASLLPRWRGAAPIIYAIKHGDHKTGVTIMKIEPKHFDIGDILVQKEISIREDMVLPELHQIMAEAGASLLIEAIQKYPNIFVGSRSQDHTQATYAPKITPDICEVDWGNMTAVQVHNLYRALYGFKHLTTHWQKRAIKVVEMRRSDHITQNGRPGFVEFSRKGKCLRVSCADGTCVDILKLSIESKKIMTAADFNNGFLKGCSTDEKYFVRSVEFLETENAPKRNVHI